MAGIGEPGHAQNVDSGASGLYVGIAIGFCAYGALTAVAVKQPLQAM